ncbi:ABC transporter ATP-binding protein [Raineyella fluvialis]|uniref:ATP-binding cassette domain-containing protein n=1 Tax=Raineyella fluvialis TaxID=2662261 RepID=A0A5Q2FE57_9ACTN|nr:ABC transporter ATP-binding protein [Raineyella fluvialis]QGF24661.1 ATP-binding cassette domain-containing protein [Raineyella fluvialis]
MTVPRHAGGAPRRAAPAYALSRAHESPDPRHTKEPRRSYDPREESGPRRAAEPRRPGGRRRAGDGPDQPDAARPADLATISAQGLTRRFGDVTAVDGVDLEIAAGSVFGLLGPDGAGKSTLLRLLATVLRPDAGDAVVCGASVTRRPRDVTPRIGYMSQQTFMYPDLSVRENLDFFATLRGVDARRRKERGTRLLEGMGMGEFAGRAFGKLSGGMKQKCMLASTLMHEPELLLLDEPTTGVDPVSRREFWRILTDLHRTGTTILVATPYMDEAERCTDVAFMAAGRITTRGTPAEITSRVPGTLCEVRAGAPREVVAALTGHPGVRSAHLRGDVARVLLDPGLDPEALDPPLAAAGVTVTGVTVVRPDMEAAFVVLAEAARSPRDDGPATGDGSSGPEPGR